MIKILKRLIKCNSDYYKKYVLIYSTSIHSEYEFMYCDEKKLKETLEQVKMFDFHIFLTKDELEFESEVSLEVEE